MAWEDDLLALFDDIEGQAEALYDADRAAELADRGRTEYAAVSLAGRLMASIGHDLVLSVRGIGPLAGRLHRVGAGWLLLRANDHGWIVPIAALDSVAGASVRAVAEPAWSPADRLGLGAALRRLAESGERRAVYRLDGAVVEGELRRVGRDFAELVTASGAEQLIPLAAIAAVRGPA